jgi:hypothetical protein
MDPTAVMLDHPGQIQLSGFVGGKALFTDSALASPTYLVPLTRQAGVDDLGVLGSAERAAHNSSAILNDKLSMLK